MTARAYVAALVLAVALLAHAHGRAIQSAHDRAQTTWSVPASSEDSQRVDYHGGALHVSPTVP